MINRKQRNENGSALIELSAVAWTMPLAAVIAVNVGLLVFGAWTNDAACREAVRAAAQQNNASDARAAALRATANFATSSGSIASSPQLLLTGNNFQFETFADSDGKPQIDKGPFVKVSTRLVAKLPAPLVFGQNGLSDKIIFTQSYTFPILNPDQVDKGIPSFDTSEVDQLAEAQRKAQEEEARLAAENQAAAALAQAQDLAASQDAQASQALSQEQTAAATQSQPQISHSAG